MRVEERKAALEQLERRIFPTGRPVMQREDSQGTPDSAQVADDDCARKTTFYENAFLKLKEATGTVVTILVNGVLFGYACFLFLHFFFFLILVYRGDRN